MHHVLGILVHILFRLMTSSNHSYIMLDFCQLYMHANSFLLNLLIPIFKQEH